MADELIGKLFGNFEIIDVLGRGGMATVYKAQQRSMNGRLVAVKVLPRHFLNDDTYLQRFIREVEIVSQLEHRNIVPVYEYGEHEGQPYIVMRYMQGGSVDQLIKQGPLEMAAILNILEQIAPALDYAHSKQVLHRDLKPSNVLLDETGGAFLTDFGIARVLGDQGGATITTQGVVGTPAYMSPEQAQGKTLDPRSDVYSLGVMLFEMCTGRQPFEGDTPYSIAVKQVTDAPPMPSLFNTSLSAAVETVILSAIAKDRERRYQTAAALVEALQRSVDPPLQGLHDTQPGFPRPDYASYTQEAPPLEATIPPPPMPSSAYNPSPITPMPPVQSTPPEFTGPRSAVISPVSANISKVPRKRRPNYVMPAALGVGVGCLLIIIVAVLAFFFIVQFTSDPGRAETATFRASTDQPATLTAVASANPLALSLWLTPRAEEPTPPPGVSPSVVTQQPTAVENVPTLEIGVRPTVTPPADTPFGSLVYVSERDGNFDLFSRAIWFGEENRITTSPAVDTQPAISPDGQWIAFASDRDGDFDIFVINFAGDDLRRVTTNSVTDRAPSWSSDGQWIVFSSDTRGDGTHDLFRARSDGSELTLLYSDGMRSSDPRFTADDRAVVFTNGQPDDPTSWEIARLTIDTGDLSFVTNNGVKDWQPVPIPDGGVLYHTEGDGYSSIALLDVNGEYSTVYDGEGYESGVQPSANGQYIVFTSDVSGQDELYLLALAAEDANPLPITTEGGFAASWWSGTDEPR